MGSFNNRILIYKGFNLHPMNEDISQKNVNDLVIENHQQNYVKTFISTGAIEMSLTTLNWPQLLRCSFSRRKKFHTNLNSVDIANLNII